jgi:hypothetical protein
MIEDIAMNIEPADIVWEDISFDVSLPRRRLLATVQIAGVHHHLEAIEVNQGGSKFDQRATCSRCDEILKRYDAVDSDGGPFNTVEIDERDYAVFLTPFRS